MKILVVYPFSAFQWCFRCKGEERTSKGKGALRGDRDWKGRIAKGVSKGKVFWFPFLWVSAGLTGVSGANPVVTCFKARAEGDRTGNWRSLFRVLVFQGLNLFSTLEFIKRGKEVKCGQKYRFPRNFVLVPWFEGNKRAFKSPLLNFGGP